MGVGRASPPPFVLSARVSSSAPPICLHAGPAPCRHSTRHVPTCMGLPKPYHALSRNGRHLDSDRTLQLKPDPLEFPYTSPPCLLVSAISMSTKPALALALNTKSDGRSIYIYEGVLSIENPEHILMKSIYFIIVFVDEKKRQQLATN